MASIFSHPAVALGLGLGLRLPAPWIATGAACTVLPDLDTLGFFAGVPYGSLLGHRGLTHSPAFAAMVAALAAALLRVPPGSRALAFAFLFLCTASHGLLDAMTDGGLGVAFLAPASGRRFFLPWTPIEVSPIGVGDFLGRRGLAILASEALWVWLPSAAILALLRGARPRPR